MLSMIPIFRVYNFFRQNIWHSIFDQFHFHHIFGDEMIVIRQDRQQTTDTLWRTMTVKSSRNILGTSWMVMRERSFKYLGAQQVSQQISIFFKSKFHNEWGVCQKSYFDVFSGIDPICYSQKFQLSQTPPSHFLLISPRFVTNIRCRYFSLNIWVVYDQLELDWCIFYQNWAKTRPLHFQIFQILNA